jgi:hypothetical protein
MKEKTPIKIYQYGSNDEYLSWLEVETLKSSKIKFDETDNH